MTHFIDMIPEWFGSAKSGLSDVVFEIQGYLDLTAYSTDLVNIPLDRLLAEQDEVIDLTAASGQVISNGGQSDGGSNLYFDGETISRSGKASL